MATIPSALRILELERTVRKQEGLILQSEETIREKEALITYLKSNHDFSYNIARLKK